MHIRHSLRAALAFLILAARVAAREINIAEAGAVADGKTLNTKAIQKAIDELAGNGGGKLVVPKGVFVSGALFLKPRVNVELTTGAVLRCSTDLSNFPPQRTRIEGHFEEKFNPGLLNADACDGLRITGGGTLDGAGLPVWEEFWQRRKASPLKENFKNLDVARARLCIVENSEDVKISGITFKDSQFWNLHLYKSRKVTVENAKFIVPDDYKQAPSSDGIDVDSCQQVKIVGCYFSVCDDCIGLKGTKGPFALEDKTSPPVENIRVANCTFKRGHGMLTCGSEATLVQDVIVEDCKVIGSMPLVRLKLRPDTPQHYENMLFRNIHVDAPGVTLFQIKKWTQYFDLKGQPEPASIVRDIKVRNITGRLWSLGVIEGNAKTTISDIALQDIDVRATTGTLVVSPQVQDLKLNNVMVNGEAFALAAAN